MISYTISNNGSYITSYIIGGATTSRTVAVNPCGKPGVETNVTIYSYIQNINGDGTAFSVLSSADNGPVKCPPGIGGYTRCNQTYLFTYQTVSSNGKGGVTRTPYNIPVGECIGNQNEAFAYAAPVVGDVFYETTEIQNSTINNYLTTIKTNVNIYSYSSVNSTKIKRITTQTDNFIQSTVTQTILPRTVVTALKSQKTFGYASPKDGVLLAKDFNHVPTVYIITNTNIFWYRTANGYPNQKQLFEQIFKSVRKKDKQNVTVTVMPIKPQINEGLVSNIPCDPKYLNKSKIQEKYIKAKYTFVSEKTTQITTNENSKDIPIKTVTSNIVSNITTVGTVITKVESQFENVPIMATTQTIVSNYKIQAGTSTFYGLFYSTVNTQSQDKYNYKASYKGECVDENNVTIYDFVRYKYLKYGNYLFFKNGANFISFNPEYIQGQITPNNLTSFVNEVVLGDGQTFKNINNVGTYGVSVLPNVIIPIPQISPTFIVDTDVKTINLTKKFNAAEVSFSSVENKKTINKVTNYEWKGEGANTSTFFKDIEIGSNINNYESPNIGDPNQIFISSKNIGKYRNDKSNSSLSLTRFLSPGSYIQINNSKTLTVNFDDPQSFNENEDIYIPYNGQMFRIESPNFITSDTYLHNNLKSEAFFKL